MTTRQATEDLAVIGVNDSRWGERPLAIVSIREQQHLSFEELAAHLATRVDRWQVPERWTEVDDLPRPSVGKIDKGALRTMSAIRRLAVQTIGVPRPS